MSDEDDFSVVTATDGHEGAIRAEYDWSNIAPSTAVVETVAIAANSEPDSLESLYDWIDTDAIDALFRGTSGDRSETPLSVSFAYDGYSITVEGDGTVTVEPSPD